MPSLTARHRGSWLPEAVEDWGRHALGRPQERHGPSAELLVAGTVILGLGVLAWAYLGPDLRRYLKIHNM